MAHGSLTVAGMMVKSEASPTGRGQPRMVMVRMMVVVVHGRRRRLIVQRMMGRMVHRWMVLLHVGQMRMLVVVLVMI